MCAKNSKLALIEDQRPTAPAVSQAGSDSQVIELWLHDRPATTAQAYAGDVAGFLAIVAKPLRTVTLADIQAYKDQLTGAARTRNRRLAAVKSLFSFAKSIGYLDFNVAGAVKLNPVRRNIGQKVVAEDLVSAMIASEDDQQRRAILITLYATGCRVSELCGLSWADVQLVGDNGEEAAKLTIIGKGSKERVVDLPPEVWRILQPLQREDPAAPIFAGEDDQPLNRFQVHRIIKRAAKRAGIASPVSCHTLRHCHATHALANGCPLHLIQRQLGHSSLAVTGIYLDAVAGESSAKFLKVPAA